ncbi:hypothetical protein M6B38_276515 [Iris pallida]|uniref:Ribosomal protein L32 n=1 Tax=Iris pallida TaxID=29817 RepID=A0AAX6I4A5_IRIPA|nr:hypothetical protein M6B38_276515 [Iris pallida]
MKTEITVNLISQNRKPNRFYKKRTKLIRFGFWSVRFHEPMCRTLF